MSDYDRAALDRTLSDVDLHDDDAVRKALGRDWVMSTSGQLVHMPTGAWFVPTYGGVRGQVSRDADVQCWPTLAHALAAAGVPVRAGGAMRDTGEALAVTGDTMMAARRGRVADAYGTARVALRPGDVDARGEAGGEGCAGCAALREALSDVLDRFVPGEYLDGTPHFCALNPVDVATMDEWRAALAQPAPAAGPGPCPHCGRRARPEDHDQPFDELREAYGLPDDFGTGPTFGTGKAAGRDDD